MGNDADTRQRVARREFQFTIPEIFLGNLEIPQH